MNVKICGITNLDDALAAQDLGASILGFNFYAKSPRYITPEAARAIAQQVSILTAGVFVNESRDEMESIAWSVGLAIAQLHGDEPETGYPRGIEVWKAYRHPFPAVTTSAETILLDGPAGGVAFDWSELPKTEKHVVIAGGLDASNVRRAIELTQPWGVDACSKIESSPGVKDHDKMAAFLAAALEGSK